MPKAQYQLTKVERVTIKENVSVKAPADIERIMRPLIGENEQESFYCISLNTKNRVLAIELVSIGTLNASIVHPREILKKAIALNAASIIISHNHPTGDPTPSREDIEFTRRMHKAGELIGIDLLDHVVIGQDHTQKYVSMKEAGFF